MPFHNSVSSAYIYVPLSPTRNLLTFFVHAIPPILVVIVEKLKFLMFSGDLGEKDRHIHFIYCVNFLCLENICSLEQQKNYPFTDLEDRNLK